MNQTDKFDELHFFAAIKARPGVYLGAASLLSLRDQLFGMEYAFSFYTAEDPLYYFHTFTAWYQENQLHDGNGYACWWNHLMYISGNNDAYAFERFFQSFEHYLSHAHNLHLPEAK